MKVQGFLLTQAGWGGAGQGEGLGRKWGKRRDGCVDGTGNKGVGAWRWEWTVQEVGWR